MSNNKTESSDSKRQDFNVIYFIIRTFVLNVMIFAMLAGIYRGIVLNSVFIILVYSCCVGYTLVRTHTYPSGIMIHSFKVLWAIGPRARIGIREYNSDKNNKET